MKTLVIALCVFAVASVAAAFFVSHTQRTAVKFNQEVMAGTLYNRAIEAQYYAQEATDQGSKMAFQERANALFESSKFIKSFEGFGK